MNKTKWIICPGCQGNCSKENPAFSNGFTSSEWSEMAAEEQEAYMAGDYDVSCDDCSGTGKVRVPNVAALNFAEKRQLVLQRQQERDNHQLDWEMNAMMQAERAAGC